MLYIIKSCLCKVKLHQLNLVPYYNFDDEMVIQKIEFDKKFRRIECHNNGDCLFEAISYHVTGEIINQR